MKRIIIILPIIQVAFGLVGRGFAYEIVIVQSSNASYYEKTVNGFMETGVELVASRGGKSARPDTVSRFYVNDRSSRGLLVRHLSRRSPDLILAVGDRALEEVKNYDDFPILHVLASKAAKIRNGRPNLTGIDMIVAPARQLAVLTEVLPSVKTVGVIYDPDNMASFIDEAKAIAEMHGIVLIAEKVEEPKEAVAMLNRFKGAVDALWMVPDPNVVSPITVEAMLGFSFDNGIPLLTFADKYLEKGAIVSVSLELYGIGVQAGRLARKIMEFPSRKMTGKVELPKSLKIRFNNRVAAKMGLLFDTAAVDDVVAFD